MEPSPISDLHADRLTVHVPSTPEALPELRCALRTWLDEVGVDDAAREDIVLACWEAAANAVEHPVSPAGAVQVQARRTPEMVEVCVADEGTWRARDRHEPRPDRGLGLRLIEALMDGVEIVRATTGTRILMRRCLPSQA